MLNKLDFFCAKVLLKSNEKLLYSKLITLMQKLENIFAAKEQIIEVLKFSSVMD